MESGVRKSRSRDHRGRGWLVVDLQLSRLVSLVPSRGLEPETQPSPWYCQDAWQKGRSRSELDSKWLASDSRGARRCTA